MPLSSKDGVPQAASITGYTSSCADQCRAALVAGAERGHGREVAAGAVARDREPVRVATELGRHGRRTHRVAARQSSAAAG